MPAAYVLAPPTGALTLLVEGVEGDIVRFHSIRGIGFGAVIGVCVAAGAVFGILVAVPVVGDIFALLALALTVSSDRWPSPGGRC